MKFSDPVINQPGWLMESIRPFFFFVAQPIEAVLDELWRNGIQAAVVRLAIGSHVS